MSFDAARTRFPECPACGCGVDENDPDFTATMYHGQWYHPICLTESGIDVESGQPLEEEEPLDSGPGLYAMESHRMQEAQQQLKR